MSGSYNRKLYDNCQGQLKLKESVTPAEYSLYVGAYENELNSEYCQKNTNSTITNKWDSIGKRTEVENELLYLVKGSNCVHDKHKPCDNSNESRCNPGVPANPRVCERDIVPTNMKMPKSCGF
jgi:hypothetical protein